MEQFVRDLKQHLPFKENTETGDIVLIAAKQPQLLLFARVGEILRDPTRKDEWWHVTLHLLSIPMQTVVWTLRMPQLTGQEIFTMGGEGRFIKALRFDDPPRVQSDGKAPALATAPQRPGLRVVK